MDNFYWMLIVLALAFIAIGEWVYIRGANREIMEKNAIIDDQDEVIADLEAKLEEAYEYTPLDRRAHS